MFDRTVGFCQATTMLRHIKKIIAVFLAIWLPVFSGNVLAFSVAMQSARGDYHPVTTQQSEHCTHHASTTQHAPSLVDHDQSASHGDQQDTGCANSGICHLACCGFMATVSIGVAAVQSSAQLISPCSTQIKSIALTPLDPPPLARV